METKKKKPVVKYETIEKSAVIHCEWNSCEYSCQKMETFMDHIFLHTSVINETPNELGFSCVWRNCCYISETRDQLVTHVLFHAFHSKLKAIGKVVMDSNGFECLLDHQSRNILPELPECFECMWDDCDIKFTSAQHFYSHTQAHANAEAKCAQIPCRWRGCKKTFKVTLRLKEHVRCHTQEKRVGCYNCGIIYHNMQRFREHFQRQREADPSFKCSYCKRQYPTEAILKCHVRLHIDHYKCPQCDMTFSRKGCIIDHLKYRHSSSRQYKCPQCPNRFKSRMDVFRHMNVHNEDASHFCPFPDCSFKCRSYDGYITHANKIHKIGSTKSFLCHMCDVRFTKGRFMTKHLRKVHNYQWPAGHKRFRYRKDEDGFHRLETSRYLSAELAEQITKSKAKDSDESDAISEPDLIIQV